MYSLSEIDQKKCFSLEINILPHTNSLYSYLMFFISSSTQQMQCRICGTWIENVCVKDGKRAFRSYCLCKRMRIRSLSEFLQLLQESIAA